MCENLTVPVYSKEAQAMEDNSRILCISDLHAPYMHPDSLDFLYKLKETLKPTRIICGGDELDYHAMSFHDSDPDLDNSGRELLLGLGYIETLFKMFPEMDLMESNHGSMSYRKAKHHGMPRHLLKSYNEVLGVDNNWRWHDKLVIDLPNGSRCMFAHSLGSDVMRSSQSIGMSLVQFHHHSQFEIRYWHNGETLNFGVTSGCLIDDKSLAFAYNKLQIKRPVIGITYIENSIPHLIPMILNKDGRWIGTRI